MNNNTSLVVLSFLLTLTILFSGCTENTQVPPFTTSQFVNQTTDANYTIFKLNGYDGMCVVVDGNKLNFGNCAEILFDANLSGSAGQIPIVNVAGNALELVEGFNFNKDTNQLSINGEVFTTHSFNGAGVIPMGVSSSSATTTSKSVTINNFDMNAGDIFAVKFTKGSTTTQQWDISVNGVWYYDVLVGGSATTGDYLLYSANAIVVFYYDGTKVSVLNPNYVNPYKRVSLEENDERPVETIYGYKLAWKDGANRFRPIIKTSGSTGNNDYPNTAGFLLGGKMVINPTGTTYSTSTIMSKSFSYIGTVGTAYNLNSSLTAYLPVYWKGTIGSDGLFYFDQTSYTSWYTQSLPTSEDGFVYVYVGNAEGTTAIGLSLEHPAYEFKNGSIRLYEQNHHVNNFKEYFGSDNNASIYFDTNGLIINPKETGNKPVIITGDLRVDGNILLKSPNGTQWNCGVDNSGVFSCS